MKQHKPLLVLCILLFASHFTYADYLEQYSQELFPSSPSIGNVSSKSVRTKYDSVFVAGSFNGIIDFYGTLLNSYDSNTNKDIFIVKFSTLDLTSTSFVLKYGQNGTDILNDLVVDSNDNIIFAGYLQGISNYGGGDINTESSQDAILVKLDQYGNHIWSIDVGSASSIDSIEKIAVDENDNIFVAGKVIGDMTWGATTYPSNGGSDIAVAMFNGTSGEILWSLQFSGDQDDIPSSIAVDAVSNSYVLANSMSSMIQINGTNHTLEAGSAVILIKLNATGNLLWYKFFNSSQSPFQGNGIAVDSVGSVFITGSFVTANFGSGLHTANGGVAEDLYLVKFWSDGSLQWISTFGGDQQEGGNSIQLDSDQESIMLAGYYQGDYLVMGNVFSSSSEAAFVANFNSTGYLQWAIPSGSDVVDMTDILIAPTSNSSFAAMIATFSGSSSRDFADQAISSYGTSSTLVAVVGDSVLMPSPSRSPNPSSSPGINKTETYTVSSVHFWNHSKAQTTASDSRGYLYLGGSWLQDDSLMLIKYDPINQTNIYAKNLSSFAEVTDIAFDSQDNCIVVVEASSPIDFGNGSTVVPVGYCLVKYDPNGNFIWSFCEDENYTASVVVVGQYDNIYVFGSYQQAWNTPQYFFAAKHSPDSSQVWIQSYDSPYNYDPVLFGVESTDGQSVYFGGLPAIVFKASASTGVLEWTNDMTAGSGSALLWAGVYSDALVASGYCTSLNISGNIVSGFYGDMDICFVALNSVGEIQWYKFIGGECQEQVRAVTQGPDDTILVTGSMTPSFGRSCFVGGNYYSNGSFFVATYDSNGTYLWDDNRGSGSADWIYSATFSGNSNSFYLVGYTNGNEVLDGTAYSYSVDNPATVALQYTGPEQKAPKKLKSGSILSLWMIIVIAVGGTFIISLVVFAIARKKRAGGNDSDDDNEL